MLCSVLPVLVMADIREDKKFKKSVLAELEKIAAGGCVDLRQMYKEHYFGLSNVHSEIRRCYMREMRMAVRVIESEMLQFCRHFQRDDCSINSCDFSKGPTGEEEEYEISRSHWEYVEALWERNKILHLIANAVAVGSSSTKS